MILSPVGHSPTTPARAVVFEGREVMSLSPNVLTSA